MILVVVVVVVVVIIAEVLRLFKCREETEENMQGLQWKKKVGYNVSCRLLSADLNPRFVDWNV